LTYPIREVRIKNEITNELSIKKGRWYSCLKKLNKSISAIEETLPLLFLELQWKGGLINQ